MSTQFTPFASLLGGILIGLSASIWLLTSGKVTGISGIHGGLLRPTQGDWAWRAFFVTGLLAGGTALALFYPAALTMNGARPTVFAVIAGLLVGFGSRLGNGCTSGHGVCGISRRSRRSIIATVLFMVAGMATASAAHHILGSTS